VDFDHMTGVEKAAVLALSLPPDAARALLDRLADDELERVLAAVARFDQVSSEVRERVLAEFRTSIARWQHVVVGGRARAAELAREALGDERADRIARGIGRDETRVDRLLAQFDAPFIARTLADEHPQTLALVLSQLPPERSAAVLGALPESMACDVVVRLARLDRVAADVIAELEAGIAELFGDGLAPAAPVGGAELAARMLNRVPRSAGQAILESMEGEAPELAAEVRRRMLQFDDLRRLDRRDFQMLLREIPIEDLVLALKSASEPMCEKVYENVSTRAAEQIREEGELLGAVRRQDVEAVQSRIVETARRLEEEGRIELHGEDADAFI
jgi:flagellar motor switch protein FliG